VATRPSCASLFTHQTRGFPSPPRGGGGISVLIENNFFLEILDLMFFTSQTKIHNENSMNVYLNFLNSSRAQFVLRKKFHLDAAPTLTGIYFRIIFFSDTKCNTHSKNYFEFNGATDAIASIFLCASVIFLEREGWLRRGLDTFRGLCKYSYLIVF
jgi:hypothetical protein